MRKRQIGAWAAFAIVCASGCLLPNYQGTGGGGASSSSVAGTQSNTASGTASGGGGAGGQPVTCDMSAPDFVAQFGSSSNRVEAYGYARRDDGSGVATGWFYDQLTYKPQTTLEVANPGSNPDAFVLGLNSTGGADWALAVSGDGLEEIKRVAVTPDGGAVVVGRALASFSFGNIASSFFTGTTVGFIGKIDAQGSAVWMEELDVGPDPEISEANSVAVAPNGDVFVVGTLQGTVTINRSPISVAEPQQTAAFPSPWFLHLNSAGDIVKFELWQSPNMAQAEGLVLAPDGSRYVSGSYNMDFPAVQIVSPPPSAGVDGYLLRLDDQDTPQEAYAYGNPDWLDSASSIALADNGDLLVLIGTVVAGVHNDHVYDVGGVHFPDDGITFKEGLNAVLARVHDHGKTGSWATVMQFPLSISNMRLHVAGSQPQLSFDLEGGTTKVGQYDFDVLDPTDALFVRFDPSTGAPVSKLLIGGAAQQQAFVLPSPCGDTIVGAFDATLMLNGTTYTPGPVDNAFVAFSKTPLVFEPLP